MPNNALQRTEAGIQLFSVYHVLPRQPLSPSLDSLGTSSHPVYIAGELQAWPTREHMAALLRAAGLHVTVGRYSVRVDDCSHFVFAQYGGDLGQPRIDADAETLADLLREAGLISAALDCADLVHRFELYNNSGVMVGYLHHRWPLAGA